MAVNSLLTNLNTSVHCLQLWSLCYNAIYTLLSCHEVVNSEAIFWQWHTGHFGSEVNNSIIWEYVNLYISASLDSHSGSLSLVTCGIVGGVRGALNKFVTLQCKSPTLQAAM